jgi:hypothetical protein
MKDASETVEVMKAFTQPYDRFPLMMMLICRLEGSSNHQASRLA